MVDCPPPHTHPHPMTFILNNQLVKDSLDRTGRVVVNRVAQHHFPIVASTSVIICNYSQFWEFHFLKTSTHHGRFLCDGYHHRRMRHASAIQSFPLHLGEHQRPGLGFFSLCRALQALPNAQGLLPRSSFGKGSHYTNINQSKLTFEFCWQSISLNFSSKKGFAFSPPGLDFKNPFNATSLTYCGTQ